MIDFASLDFRRNPFPVYDQLRAAGPVLRDPRTGLWLLFDYDSVRQALTDHQQFSSSFATAGRSNPAWLIFADPPRQQRLRALIGRAFTPRAVAELEPHIRQISRELIHAVLALGSMELVADYAAPLPMRVIAGMLGLPADDWPRFRRWSDGILRLSYAFTDSSSTPAAVAAYAGVQEEMRPWLRDLFAQRMAHPEHDLLTHLMEAEIDGDHLTDDEIAGFVELLIVAGQETSSNLIANSVLCLSESTDQRDRILSAPELRSAAIEEVLRFRSPVQWVFRVAKSDVVLHGQKISAGEVVIPVLGAANRDPDVFPDPHHFDITRTDNHHLAFGHGLHFCLGAALDRLEARIAMEDLYTRLRGLELGGNELWEPRPAVHVHGPAKLEVRFQPGKPGPT